jgi:predicted nucleic acid-binding protein
MSPVSKIWIVNASPLIVLSKIGHSDLLVKLAEHVVLPSAVFDEVTDKDVDGTILNWINRQSTIKVQSVAIQDSEIASWDLGAGESEVLTLARLIENSTVVIDDKSARNCADSFGIPKLGTLGVVVLAKKYQLITEIKPLIGQLTEIGFYMSPILISEVLELVGEN